MEKIGIQNPERTALVQEQVQAVFDRYVRKLPANLKKILILPPDATRLYSRAGWLTRLLYERLKTRADVTIMPATGTHHPMTDSELTGMFGDVPYECFAVHHWREDTALLGVVPAQVMGDISSGALSEALTVKVNRRLLSGEFDLIVSLGQVLPHEVVGMANYSKNVLVGAGGEEIINISHFLGAVYGLERLIGRDHSPVRRLYDYAETNFLARLPLHYILIVNSTRINPGTGFTDLIGLFMGRDRSNFEEAVALSQQCNITLMPAPVEKFVVYLDPQEFHSSWVGCKAIYRTRLAVADGGEIVVVAPGLDRFGENKRFDRLIRQFGYAGTEQVMKFVSAHEPLRDNLAAAAHLIHGSTEGRFRVTIATDAIDGKEIEKVHFGHMGLEAAEARYGWRNFSEDGWQRTPDGEHVYYIANPAGGLWAAEEKYAV